MSRRTTGVAQAISRRSRTLTTGRFPSQRSATPPSIAERRRETDLALVAADDTLLASAEELAAVEDPDLPDALRCSDYAIAPFAAALNAAQSDVDTAFALREQASAESDQDTESGVLEHVEQLSRAASARLDAQSRAFDAVRNFDRAVSSVVPALQDKVQILQARLAESMQLLGDLTSSFPTVALAGARTDLDQATDRVEFAYASLAVADQLLRSGDRRGAIARARASEAAARQATLLLDELADAPDELARAVAGIEVLLDQTGTDLSLARQLTAAGATAPALRFAAATLEWATGARTSGRLDPLGTRRALMESDSALVRALGESLAPDRARERATMLDGCYAEAAFTSVRGATTAIATRRAVVGAEARLRLAAARRTLTSANHDEPVMRIEHLQQAERLADQALALAHSDEARAHDRAATAGKVHDQLAVAVIGGILVPASTTRDDAAGPEDRSTFPGGPAEAAEAAVAAVSRLGQLCAVSFGGLATRARRGGAGRF